MKLEAAVSSAARYESLKDKWMTLSGVSLSLKFDAAFLPNGLL